jgi:hypothetical protein
VFWAVPEPGVACDPDAPIMPPLAAPCLFPRPSRSESTRGSALLAMFDWVERVSSVGVAEAGCSQSVR